MAIDPIAVEAWVSVRGTHVVPPLVVFHTPPCAPPRYTMLALPGSIASALTRPDTTGSLYGGLMGWGPIKFHEGLDAVSVARGALTVRSAAISSSSCFSARCRA